MHAIDRLFTRDFWNTHYYELILFFQQQGVIYINTAQSGMMYNMQSTQTATGNQLEYHQMSMPHMQGYYSQQPTILPNNQQQACHSNRNQMPMQGYYGRQPPSVATANQHHNINAQQL